MKQVNLKEILLNSFIKYKEDFPENRLSKAYTIEQFQDATEILTVGMNAMQEACNQTVDLCAENADLCYYDSQSEIPDGEVSTGDSEYGYYSIDKRLILDTKKQII